MGFWRVISFPFRKIIQFFGSKKVQNALEKVADLVPIAESIVKELSGIDPRNTTANDLVALYEKYQIPVEGIINQTPTGFGNALLNLATILMRRAQPGIATSSIQAAIQIALVAIKNK